MYARVAVASNALDMGSVPPLVAGAMHDALIQALHAHGRLVFASNTEAMDFIRAIRGTAAMPPGARTRWDALLVHLKKCHRVTVSDPTSQNTLATVDAIDRLRAGWGSQADIAVVAQALSSALGVPEDTGVLSAPGVNPDVAVAVAAPNAPALTRILDQEQNPFAPHRSDRETFWTDVLEPVATDATEVTLLDGYLFNHITEVHSGRRRSSGAAEHICWLLDRLDNVTAGRATVRLIGNGSKVATGDNASSIAQLIHDRWAPLKVGRLGKVEVHLATPSGGQRFPHDRHIRFSTGSAVKFPAGFDRLSEELIRDTSGMWWTYLWQTRALDELRADEKAGLSLSRHPEALVLSR